MLPSASDRTTSNQPSLFDHGQHARETRAIAAASAIEKGPSRRAQIEQFVTECGKHGATRHEVAAEFGWPLSSVCGPCLALLRSGRLNEVGKRESPYGSPAAVLVSVSLNRGTDR